MLLATNRLDVTNLRQMGLDVPLNALAAVPVDEVASAREIGVKIPQTVMLGADRMIE